MNRPIRTCAVACFLLAWTSLAVAAPRTDLSRVVALGGDITETIYLINAQQALVGVDSTSQWPTAAKRLPDVGYVRRLNAEGVLALHPRLIIATHDAGPATVIAQLRSAGVHVQQLPRSRTPADVVAKIHHIGRLLGRPAQATKLADKVERQYTTLVRDVASMPRHPLVVFLMSAGSGSPMAAGRGTAADRAITLAGGHNAADSYRGYKPVSAEALVALAPQVIVMMRELVSSHGGIKHVLQIPGVAQTPAGKARHIILVDGEALLGFGPRSATAAQALQHALAGTMQ